jgi:hypothetical protein
MYSLVNVVAACRRGRIAMRVLQTIRKTLNYLILRADHTARALSVTEPRGSTDITGRSPGYDSDVSGATTRQHYKLLRSQRPET